jgi:hypothetical protein
MSAATGQLQHKDGFLEFIVPDVLKAQVSRERYRESTFDRQLAIKRTDADFLALGHPIIDAEIAYVGSHLGTELGGPVRLLIFVCRAPAGIPGRRR